jgi:DNA-binding transcriptional LysR family regulator
MGSNRVLIDLIEEHLSRKWGLIVTKPRRWNDEASMRDNIEGIDVFVASAEAGSFARAADRLALTRSAVGKTIARLEERLGVRLFHRTTRSQSLTEQGQIYYERCLRALAELRMGQALLDQGGVMSRAR